MHGMCVQKKKILNIALQESLTMHKIMSFIQMELCLKPPTFELCMFSTRPVKSLLYTKGRIQQYCEVLKSAEPLLCTRYRI
jgi:hypothetical protein